MSTKFVPLDFENWSGRNLLDRYTSVIDVLRILYIRWGVDVYSPASQLGEVGVELFAYPITASEVRTMPAMEAAF